MVSMRSALRTAPALAALLLVLTGCRGSGPTAYGTEDRTITVDHGEKFTLKVPANPELGQNWYLASPREDADVLKYRGDREDTGDSDGTQFFDFTALSPGKATVKLLFCPYGRCHSADEAASKPVPTATRAPKDSDQEAAYYLYAITVR
ncbi:protease inhibitor I42 family protein [Streptomyces sp. NPDC048496]|uniref:protease inhibitor I42 family protein n=1 Tax=Streptomyces sp. NPDC048496 TaxID=3365558 RepID=UPI00371A9F46